MKKLNDKIKYTIERKTETAFLYARPKVGRIVWTRFASCHPSVIPAMKKDGFAAWKHLIRVLPQFPNVASHCAP